eukprot:c24221_g1_i1 orf=632-1258(-)
MAFPRCAMQVAALWIMVCCLMMHAALAMEYTVGGAKGWTVGEDLETWASQYTFYVGDELYFPYAYGQSSVLLVTEKDYNDCNTNDGVASDGGLGDMEMSLLTPQTYYFISGHSDQCSQGLRLEVPVLAAPPPGTLQPTLKSPPSSAGDNSPSSSSTNIPTSPVILSPPRSINTPYSTLRPNSSPPSLSAITTLFSLALTLATITYFAL